MLEYQARKRQDHSIGDNDWMGAEEGTERKRKREKFRPVPYPTTETLNGETATLPADSVGSVKSRLFSLL